MTLVSVNIEANYNLEAYLPTNTFARISLLYDLLAHTRMAPLSVLIVLYGRASGLWVL